MFLSVIFEESSASNLRVIRTLFDYTRSMAAPAGVFGPNRIVVRIVRGVE